MYQTRKLISIVALATLLALTLVTTVYAFDGRGGDRVVIRSGEVINDDLYVGAQEFVLDGTVDGDLIAFGQTVTVNGKVDGDLIAAAQTVAVYGEVTGSIRMAGSVLFVGEEARVGRDIVAAGYSLEVREGGTIDQDLVYAGGQILLAGDVERNVQVAAAAFELRSSVGGDVTAEVGEAGQVQAGPPPTMFMPPSPVGVPNVKQGLTIDTSAKIEGDLEYTQKKELTIPAGTVSGQVTRTVPATTTSTPREESSGEKIVRWSLNFVRSGITLIVIGLLLFWLFPAFMSGWSDDLRARPWESLGWGALAWVGFYVAVLLLVFAMILGGIVFGVLTLGQLSGTVIWVGLLTLFALIIGFVLVTTFVAKVVFGAALGKWIFARLNSALAEHRFWPMIVGVLITLTVTTLLSFPLIPGVLGWLLNFAVVLFGLGALWIWGRRRMMAQPAA